MDAQQQERRFPRDEVGDIIDVAARLDDLVDDPTDRGLTLDQLIHVAAEVGISPDAVRRAIREERKRRVVDDREARKRVRRRMRFVRHALVYIVVVSSLLLIDALNGGGWWFYWPMIGWGIGLLIHILVVVAPVFSSDWVERRAERILDDRR